eukprot:366566-Chlamydomonas_euryale.AAC.4
MFQPPHFPPSPTCMWSAWHDTSSSVLTRRNPDAERSCDAVEMALSSRWPSSLSTRSHSEMRYRRVEVEMWKVREDKPGIEVAGERAGGGQLGAHFINIGWALY